MEHAERTLAQQVAARLDALDTNAFAFERLHGLPADAVRSILRGGKKSGTTLNKAQEVCEALGLEFYIGPPRDRTAPPPTIPLDGEDFAAIPRLAVEASAGAGAFNGEAEVVGKFAFRKDWLRKIAVKPEKAMLITVTGDSMAPDLQPGDLALIDQDRATWEHNRVFALVDTDGGVRIKRILIDRGRALVLLSDNPEHAPEARTGQDADRVRCLGRVVWSGHVWG